MDITRLPIFPHLPELAALLAGRGLLLLAAEPGAGKTTLLPWHLLSHPDFGRGKILLLEPRRLAARAAAGRIAALLEEPLGRTIGVRTRLETLVSAETRLEVVTEGVLTRLLQADPGLTGYGTILFDEFHTRSLQGDLGLALAWETRKHFRPDLRIALLSATLPKEEILGVYGPWPVVEVPGRVFPVEVIYRPSLSGREQAWEAAARLILEALAAAPRAEGTILCFLPGYREMNRARELLTGRRPDLQDDIWLLHGRMPPEKQNRILNPDQARGRRVVLATNVAETSLTVPGVQAVVDLGLERRVRFSPRTGMDHWETAPISLASAEQRKGRAGRYGPGRCWRWWQEGEPRRRFSPPEIVEADLAPLVLETACWGAASPHDLTWLTPPPQAGVRQAAALLATLGMLDAGGKATPAGREAVAFSIHPRLAKMVLEARAENLTATAAVMAALLENDDLLPGRGNDPDFRDRIAAWRDWAAGRTSALEPGPANRVWEDARRLLRTLGCSFASPAQAGVKPESAGRLLLSAYPDRAAQRTRWESGAASRWLLASGRGARLQGSLSQMEYLAVADLDGGETDARIFMAAPVSFQDLISGAAGRPRECRDLEWNGWKPRAKQQTILGALVLEEKSGPLPLPAALQSQALARLKEQGLAALPWSERAERLLARCRFVEKWGQQQDWPVFGDETLLAQAEHWLAPFGRWEGGPVWDASALYAALESRLGWKRRSRLDALAPETLMLPSGSVKKLDYRAGEAPLLSARLQEFFGCTTTPEVCGQPLLLELLSPAGRPVQLTRDLDGFWDRAYPAVKKELRGRYPRHYWPENPRAAQATARAKPKNQRRK